MWVGILDLAGEGVERQNRVRVLDVPEKVSQRERSHFGPTKVRAARTAKKTHHSVSLVADVTTASQHSSSLPLRVCAWGERCVSAQALSRGVIQQGPPLSGADQGQERRTMA